MNPRFDLDELTELVDLPDTLFRWSLEISTGEVYPGPDEHAQVLPIPQLTDEQILDWMASFATSVSEPRLRDLLATALRHPAPGLRYRQILSVNPRADDEWTEYFDQKRRTILVDWLASLGLHSSPEAD